MKASVLTDFGKIEYKDVPEPKAGSGEAIVRVETSGVCGTIAEIGSGNPRGLEEVIRVAVQPYYSCGVCDMCLTGRALSSTEVTKPVIIRGSIAQYLIPDTKNRY